MEISSPNLPYKFWCRNKQNFQTADKSCGEFPEVLSIRWKDKYWQIFKSGKSVIQNVETSKS